ncbi:MAG: tRNA 2-thiocytidine biosynthesis TtcA family protein [Treponema sp.]|nr:tRNA 2-thiocytidine biosynthesis TtcA family protein [Treponema sp.]MCL2272148.1 tRNA 2-thiocytidine biosynthesis TtcA family protein [Treponema sp.]
MKRFFRKTNACETVKKLVTRAVMERSLICEGDRVLVAVSGGKDSSVLSWALSAIKPALKLNCELSALHISTDFCACCKKGALSEKLDEWGVPFTDLFVPVIGRLKEGKKMNCYWCSTQRRTELLKYAVENGFNKIALGHHLDDIIETFFMNLCSKGTLLAMPILLKYKKYPVSLIRPLALLEEKQIIACAAENNILKNACTCPYGQNSKRHEMRRRLAEFTGVDAGDIKRRILKALAEGKNDYLTE